jgi:hypothetical protein
MTSLGMQTKSSVYHELLEAMAHIGCPVCRMIDRAVRQYVDVFFYENITNVERRAEIREARGYCSVHGALLAGHSRMLGTAIIQHDVINDVLREINRVLPKTGPHKSSKPRKPQPLNDLAATPLRNSLTNAVKPKRNCPLCEYEHDQERILLRIIIDDVHEPEMRAAFERSSGLCLPHLQTALQLRGVNADGLRLVTQIERDILQALKADLDEYLVKSNGSYNYEGMGKEADSPMRAVKIVSGRVFGRR